MAPVRASWALLNSTMLAAAFLGAVVFGRVADLLGRTRVYWLVAVIMVLGGGAGLRAGPLFWVLIVFRFVLGFGVVVTTRSARC